MDQLLNSLKSALPKLSSERVWISVLILIAGIILAVAVLTLIVIQAVKAFKKKQQE